jgi:hypothetical protein
MVDVDGLSGGCGNELRSGIRSYEGSAWSVMTFMFNLRF